MSTVLDDLIIKIGPEFVNLDRLRAFEARIDRVRQKLDRTASVLGRWGIAATGAAAGPVIAFAKYEENLAKIEGLVGVSREQIDEWHDDIADIATATGIGPEKLADALYDITSAGLRGETAMQVLEQSAKASAAGLGEQKDIADLVTSAVNAYGEENLSAAEAVDHLTEAVRLGKLAPEEMAGAMGRALPIASALGVEFNEVAGLLAAMSRTGTNADEGVTQLNAVMSALIKPADSAHDALDKVGLSIDGLREMAEGEQGLWGVLRELKTAFGDDVEAMAEVFPNVRALRGVFDLLGDGILVNDQIMRDMRDSTGITDEAFQAMEQTLMHQWRVALATVKVLLVDIGSTMEGTIKTVLELAKEWMVKFSQLPQPIKEIIGKLLLLGPALIVVAVAAKVASITLGLFAPFISTLTKVAGAARLIGPALWAIVATNPWLLALAAVAAAIIVAWEPVSTFFVGLWNSLADSFGSGGDVMDEFSEGAIEEEGKIVGALRGLMDELGPIGDGIMWVFRQIGDAWDAMTGLFDQDLTEAGGTFGDVLVDTYSTWIDLITDMIGTWTRLVNLFSKPIVAFFKQEEADEFSEGVLPDSQVAGFPAAIEAAKAAWDDLVEWVGGTTLITTIRDVFASVKDIIKNAFGFGDVLADEFSEGTIEEGGLFASLFDAIDEAKAGWDNLVEWFSGTDLGAAIQNALANVRDVIKNALGFGDEIADEFSEGTIEESLADTLLARIKDAFAGVVAWLDEFDLIESGKAIMESLGDGIKEAKDSVVESVKGAFEKVTNFLPFSDAKEGPFSRLTEAGKAIIDTLSEGMRRAQIAFPSFGLMDAIRDSGLLDETAVETSFKLQGGGPLDQLPSLDKFQIPVEMVPSGDPLTENLGGPQPYTNQVVEEQTAIVKFISDTIPDIADQTALVEFFAQPIPEIEDQTSVVDQTALVDFIEGATPRIDDQTATLDFTEGATVPSVVDQTSIVDFIEGAVPAIDDQTAIIEFIADAIPSIEDQTSIVDFIEGVVPAIDDQTAIIEFIADAIPSIEDQTAIVDFIEGAVPAIQSGAAFDLPVAPYPVPPLTQNPAGGSAASAPNEITITFSQGAIQINAPGGDSREIAAGISERLSESMRAVVEQMDSKVLA